MSSPRATDEPVLEAEAAVEAETVPDAVEAPQEEPTEISSTAPETLATAEQPSEPPNSSVEAPESAAEAPESAAEAPEPASTAQPAATEEQSQPNGENAQADYTEAWKQYYAAQEAAAQAAASSFASAEPEHQPDSASSTTTPAVAAEDLSPQPIKRSGHAADQGKAERGVLNPSKIYIGGLPEHTSQEDLQDCFGQLGTVTGVELKNGFGFVEFAESQAASDAVAKYHGGHFLGAEIRVELSHNGSRAKPYVGGEAGACFKCGKSGHWARDCTAPYAGRGGMGRGRGGAPGFPPQFSHPSYGAPGYGMPAGARGGYAMQPYPSAPYPGPPMQGGYDPRAPYPPPQQQRGPYDDYYRREQAGGPTAYAQPYGMPPQPGYGSPPQPGYGMPPQPPRGSAWGPPQGSPGQPMGSPTFGGPGRGADPYSGFSARPGDARDPYGGAPRYDLANGRDRSPHQRRRSLSPRRDGSFSAGPGGVAPQGLQNGFAGYPPNGMPYRR